MSWEGMAFKHLLVTGITRSPMSSTMAWHPKEKKERGTSCSTSRQSHLLVNATKGQPAYQGSPEKWSLKWCVRVFKIILLTTQQAICIMWSWKTHHTLNALLVHYVTPLWNISFQKLHSPKACKEQNKAVSREDQLTHCSTRQITPSTVC